MRYGWAIAAAAVVSMVSFGFEAEAQEQSPWRQRRLDMFRNYYVERQPPSDGIRLPPRFQSQTGRLRRQPTRAVPFIQRYAPRSSDQVALPPIYSGRAVERQYFMRFESFRPVRPTAPPPPTDSRR